MAEISGYRDLSGEKQDMIFHIFIEHFADVMDTKPSTDDPFEIEAQRDEPGAHFDPDTHVLLQVFTDAGYSPQRLQSLARLALPQAQLINQARNLTPEQFLDA